MYHGDVKVKQENLKVFFKTAKSFKIKGLTDAESLFSNTFGSAPPHTASQFQTIQTVRVQSPEKVSSSETRQSAQPISNNLPVEGHANANAQIKTEKGEDDPQLVLNGVEAEGGNNESNHNDESVEQGQQLAVKRERPSSSHASEIAPKVKRAKQLNRNGNETANQFLERSFDFLWTFRFEIKFSDLIGYNIIADIQTNAKGKENLFYADHKFSRGAKGALGSQRWSCSKASNTKCRAAMSTLDVGGITMMKVLFGEHSH